MLRLRSSEHGPRYRFAVRCILAESMPTMRDKAGLRSPCALTVYLFWWRCTNGLTEVLLTTTMRTYLKRLYADCGWKCVIFWASSSARVYLLLEKVVSHVDSTNNGWLRTTMHRALGLDNRYTMVHSIYTASATYVHWKMYGPRTVRRSSMMMLFYGGYTSDTHGRLPCRRNLGAVTAAVLVA